MTPGQNLTMKLLATASICLVALAAASCMRRPRPRPSRRVVAEPAFSRTSCGSLPAPRSPISARSIRSFPVARIPRLGTAPVTDDVDERAGAPRVGSATGARSAEPGDPVLSSASGARVPNSPAPPRTARRPSPSPGTAGTPLAETSTSMSRFSGTATVMGGDMLRVAGRMLVLHGADAPETGRVCFSGRSITWKCGDKAQEALRGFADGRYVSRSMKKPLGENVMTAVCETNGIGDIGAARSLGHGCRSEEVRCPLCRRGSGSRARSAGVWVVAAGAPSALPCAVKKLPSNPTSRAAFTSSARRCPVAGDHRSRAAGLDL